MLLRISVLSVLLWRLLLGAISFLFPNFQLQRDTWLHIFIRLHVWQQ